MKIRVAVDAMGGDRSPEEIINGAIKASQTEKNLDLILVGKSDIIEAELNKYTNLSKNIQIEHASQKIGMNESPAYALRQKKDSSIIRGCKLVKENKADAFISAGNTGAVMAGGILHIGRLEGIKRPSIATVFPAREGETLVLDVGANVDSKPENLIQFAIMGQIYARNVLNKKHPRVGLLNIGEEEEKGNKLTTEAHELFKKDIRIENFIGNVEGRDIFSDNCDVVICDGFTGNVVLKTTEGVASFMYDMLKEALTRNWLNKLGALLVKSSLKNMMSRMDYRQYGGAPLLGIDGVAIISHGSSDSTAIFNAVKVAIDTIDKGVVEIIRSEINRDGDKNESKGNNNGDGEIHSPQSADQ